MSTLDGRAQVPAKDMVKTTSKQRAFEIDSGRIAGYRWLDDPIVMSRLKHAVEHGEADVMLDGRKFLIEYGHDFPSKVVGHHDGRAIKLYPADPKVLVPFGYVSMRRIERFDFERGS